MSKKEERMYLLMHLKCFGDFNHDFFCMCPFRRECGNEAVRRMVEFAEKQLRERSRGKR